MSPRFPGRPPELPVARPGDIIDLSRATCTAAPGTHSAAVRALDRLPPRLATDGYELAGLPELRVKLAERYTRAGLPTSPDQIFVTSGSQSAISLSARTFIAPGDRVVVESPGYPHAFNALRGAGGRLLPFRVDADEGWDVDGFELTVRRSLPTLAFLMPDFHNPTSRSMTVEERHRVVATAEAHGIMVVSDEATADLALEQDGTRSRRSPRSRSDRARCSPSVRRARPFGVDFEWAGSAPASRTSTGSSPPGSPTISVLRSSTSWSSPNCSTTSTRFWSIDAIALRDSRDALERALQRPSAVLADEPDAGRHRVLGAPRRTRELGPHHRRTRSRPADRRRPVVRARRRIRAVHPRSHQRTGRSRSNAPSRSWPKR